MIKNILPRYLLIGVSKQEFMDSCPVELEPYVIAYNNSAKQKDEEMWQMGIYIENAVYVAVSKSLYGRKSKAEYIKKPLYKLREDAEHEEELSESEKVEGRKNLLIWLQTMQANFELNHASD